MITDEELEQLTNEQLIHTIIQEFDPDLSFTDFMMDLSNEFNVPLKNGSEFSKLKKYAQQRRNLRNELINNIRRSRLVQNAPPPPPEPTQQSPIVDWNRTAQPLRELSEVDRLRLRNQELERENTRLRNYIMEHPPIPPEPKQQAPEQRGFADISKVQLKPVNKKELQEREDERLNDWRVVVNDEKRQFKKSHHQMNFDEYQKATEKSNEKIAKLIAYLNENRNQWKIEFDKIKPEVLDANKQLFID